MPATNGHRACHTRLRCTTPTQVRLTVVEIYCEKIRDLLDPLGRDNLPIKQGLDGGMFVEGALRVC